MLQARRKVVVVAAVMAVLFGLAAESRDVRGWLGLEREGRPAPASLVDAAPVAVAPAATRPRTALDSELFSSVGSPKPAVGGLVLVLGAMVTAALACWWCLSRPDRRLAPPLLRSSLVALRAPPVRA